MLKIVNFLYNPFSRSSSDNLLKIPASPLNEKIYPNKLNVGIFNIPHPNKVLKGGEDAYCIREGLLAVADGVGGWISRNVDPALYSRELCENIGTLYDLDRTYRTSPKKLLMEAAYETKQEGSSTCLIITLDKEKSVLYTSYIGDSGFLLIRQINRELVLVYQTVEHCRSFNFPYQIGSVGDSPLLALYDEIKVQNNDIIIAGSDGLFDNLSTELIINCVRPFLEHGEKIPDIKLVAETIATFAFEVSGDKNFKSKFAEKAKKNNISFQGGKRDDITVIAAQIEIF